MSERLPPASCTVDLSIIIVSWNVRDLLQHCLDSILQGAHPAGGSHPDACDRQGHGLWVLSSSGHRFEMLVVDSASSDGTPDMVRKLYPGIQLHASNTNLGYTGGNNLGIRHSRGRYLLLLNPDTEVIDDALAQMATYMDSHPQVGVLGPQLRYPDGRIQASRRRLPTLRTALVDSTFLEKWFPASTELRRYKFLDHPADRECAVDWLVGACLLVRREAVDQIGLLDESYFMYSEELDWQKRMRDAAWKAAYVPSALVIHHEGKSSEQAGAATHIRFSRSKVRYFAKHHGRIAGQVVRGWLILNYLYEWSMEAAKWTLGHKRSLRRARMHDYAQVLSSLASTSVPMGTRRRRRRWESGGWESE
jgi:N-acetylglucosaminyl-diphospho-decaprenol L-rhamnosyltransferase